MSKSQKGITKKNRKLKNQLAIIVSIIILIPTVVLTTINYQSSQSRIIESEKEMIKNHRDSTLKLAGSISEQINLYIDDSINLAETIMQTQNFDELSRFEKEMILNRLKAQNRQFNALYMIDKTGNIMASTVLRNKEVKFSDKAWFEEAKKGEIHITDSYIDENTKLPGVMIALPLRDQYKRQIGVLGINMSLDKIFKIVKDQKIGENGYVYVVDKTGTIIGHKKYEEMVLDRFNALDANILSVKSVISGESGVNEYQGINGEEVIGAYDVADTTGWGVIAELPKSEVNEITEMSISKIRQQLKYSLIISLILIIGGIFTSSFVGRLASKPIIKLVKNAEGIKNGDLTKRIEVDSNNEIGMLQKSYNNMTEALYGILVSLNDATKNVRNTSEKLGLNTQVTLEAAEEICSAIDEVANVSELQANNIKESDEIAENMNEYLDVFIKDLEIVFNSIDEASQFAEEGINGVKRINESMDNIMRVAKESGSDIQILHNDTESIGDIVNIITEISQRTNLLALNAAIEAARAGKYGKGFAVVADEVRELSNQTSDAAKKITDLINKVSYGADRVMNSMSDGIKGVEEGTEIVKSTTDSFNIIVDKTFEVKNKIHEFNSGINKLNNGMEKVQYSIKDVLNASETTASSSQAVLASIEEQQTAIENINASVQQLSCMAEELQQIINCFNM